MIKALFPQLSSLVVEEIAEQGSILRIRARTPATAVACPECGEPAERVHAYHRRRLADLPAGGRGVVIVSAGAVAALPDASVSAAHVP